MNDLDTTPVNTTNYPDEARIAIEKDLHLLEAAQSADGVIITLDEKLKKALLKRADGKAFS